MKTIKDIVYEYDKEIQESMWKLNDIFDSYGIGNDEFEHRYAQFFKAFTRLGLRNLVIVLNYIIDTYKEAYNGINDKEHLEHFIKNALSDSIVRDSVNLSNDITNVIVNLGMPLGVRGIIKEYEEFLELSGLLRTNNC